MKNIRPAACCENCKHCVINSNIDCAPRYWCNQSGAYQALESFKPKFPSYRSEFLDRRVGSLIQFLTIDAVESCQDSYSCNAGDVCDLFQMENP